MDRRPHNLDETMENETSFDLNAAIQRWRGQLSKFPSFRADDLEELESHVRDSALSLRAQGLTDEEAFLIAVRRTGAGDVLAAEFAAVNGSSVWLDRLLWMIMGSIAISALWSLTTTVLFVGTALAWFAPVTLVLALVFGLRSPIVRQFLAAPERLAIAFLVVNLFSVLLRTSLMDNRLLGPTAHLPYIQRLLLYNITFFIQLVASVGLIAVIAFKRPKPIPL
jgi:hypothetical protein